MRLIKKGVRFFSEQARKLTVFPVYIIVIQFFAKIIPFLPLIPKDKVEKLCLYSQETVINFIEKSIDISKIKNESNVKTHNFHGIPRIIWVMWLQGMDDAPYIVKRCFDSLSIFAKKNNIEVRFVTKKNITQFIEIPNHIQKLFLQGKINGANYSDYCRCSLLSKYGGIWIDSTILINNDFKINMEDLMNQDFFTIKNENAEEIITNISRHRWNTFLLGSCKEFKLFTYSKIFFEKYYEQFDIVIDYLLIDYAMHFAYESIEEVKEIVDNVPINNIGVLWVDKNSNKKFESDLWTEIARRNLFFKLNRKNNYNMKDGTVIETVLGGSEIG